MQEVWIWVGFFSLVVLAFFGYGWIMHRYDKYDRLERAATDRHLRNITELYRRILKE